MSLAHALTKLMGLNGNSVLMNRRYEPIMEEWFPSSPVFAANHPEFTKPFLSRITTSPQTDVDSLLVSTPYYSTRLNENSPVSNTRKSCLRLTHSDLQTPVLPSTINANFKTPLAYSSTNMVTPSKPRLVSLDTICRMQTPSMLVRSPKSTPRKHPYVRPSLKLIYNLDSDPLTAPTTVERLKRTLIEKQQLKKQSRQVFSKSSSLKIEIIEGSDTGTVVPDSISEALDDEEVEIDDLLS